MFDLKKQSISFMNLKPSIKKSSNNSNFNNEDDEIKANRISIVCPVCCREAFLLNDEPLCFKSNQAYGNFKTIRSIFQSNW